MGDSGSPSIDTSFPSLWKTSCPHPTPQYGQIERLTSAFLFFGASCFVCSLIASVPVPRQLPERICRRTGQPEKKWLGIATSDKECKNAAETSLNTET